MSRGIIHDIREKNSIRTDVRNEISGIQEKLRRILSDFDVDVKVGPEKVIITSHPTDEVFWYTIEGGLLRMRRILYLEVESGKTVREYEILFEGGARVVSPASFLRTDLTGRGDVSSLVKNFLFGNSIRDREKRYKKLSKEIRVSHYKAVDEIVDDVKVRVDAGETVTIESDEVVTVKRWKDGRQCEYKKVMFQKEGTDVLVTIDDDTVVRCKGNLVVRDYVSQTFGSFDDDLL